MKRPEYPGGDEWAYLQEMEEYADYLEERLSQWYEAYGKIEYFLEKVETKTEALRGDSWKATQNVRRRRDE